MSFKMYICIFTFCFLVSAMADPIPSKSHPDHEAYEAKFLTQFKELISSNQEAFDYLIEISPRAFEDLEIQLYVAEELANNGKLGEAEKALGSVPMFKDFGLNAKQLYDFMVVCFNNYEEKHTKVIDIYT
ncbi:UNVERIFIED_CONTAM: hypothetical protein RMT77_011177 [Armadillidium vulgare]